MIVERHYDDETLIGLLASRNSEALRDPHLAVCSSCSEMLASYRAIAEVLGDDAVWDLRDLRDEPVPETISSLRSLASGIAADETAAADAVARLLDQPESTWYTAVSRQLELQTPSVVGTLVAASEEAIDHVPLRALAIASLATQITRLLPAEAYPGDTVLRTRGMAWRQYAYAAFYVGDNRKANEAIEEARRAFEACLVSDYDLARLAVVHGLVLSAEDRHTEACERARDAAEVFKAFGDRQRFASARMTEVFSLLQQSRYRDALTVLQSLENGYTSDLDNDLRARVVANLAICYSHLGQIRDAFDHYQIAAAMFDDLNNQPEAARVRLNVMSLLADSGRLSDAKVRYHSLRPELERLGMQHAVVFADLDMVGILLSENSWAEAEALCISAVEQFRTLGLSATTQGMTALMYLREAAAQRRATPQAARHVRKYIERLPKEPNLLFAPPPLPLS